MCIVSAIHDYGMQRDIPWTQPSIDIFQDLIKKGQEFDDLTRQPHCEDPTKVEFLKHLQAMKDARVQPKKDQDVAAELKAAQAEIAELKAQLDAVYLERNKVVALAARMAAYLECPATVTRTAEDVAPEWRNAIYIALPTGQVSWHFHDRDAAVFAGVPYGATNWDGHTTEQKYERVAAAFQSPPIRQIKLGGLVAKPVPDKATPVMKDQARL